MDSVLQRALPLARLALIGAIAYSLASTAWYFLSGPNTTSTPTQAVANVGRAETGPSITWQDIARVNLFGPLSAAPVTPVQEAPKPQAVAKETRLPLTLLGVFQADHAEDSAAIVAQKGKAGIRYAIGETMPGNAELVEVYNDHIILRRAGVREALRFPKTELIAPTTSTASRNRSPAQITPPLRNRRPAARVASRPTNRAAPAASARDLVETYREQLETNADAALKELGVTPVATGAAEGYRLGAMASSPYLRNTGLLAGDVLLSVNGEPVGNASSDRLQVDSLLAQGTARLEIQRGTRRFFVTASLK